MIEDQESEASDEMRTIELVRAAAESIVSWLSFTVDIPSMHESGKVPMLDLEVWVCKMDQGPDVLTWDFYEKPSSSLQGPKGQLGLLMEGQDDGDANGGLPSPKEHLQAGVCGEEGPDPIHVCPEAEAQWIRSEGGGRHPGAGGQVLLQEGEGGPGRVAHSSTKGLRRAWSYAGGPKWVPRATGSKGGEVVPRR